MRRIGITLPHGANVPVRTIRSDDVSALRRFHGRLSERSIHLRFFGSMKELPEHKARYFADTNGIDHFALIALDPDEQDEIIAVVRYDRRPGSERAEYAALVEDHWQGHGVGVSLTRQLIDARTRGVRRFYALIMHGNGGMLRLLRSLDLPESERRDGNDKYVDVELQELNAYLQPAK